MISNDLKARMLACKRVCVFTGAGVSAESGIPTFRDSGGLWENYKPEDLVTPEAFSRDPLTVWRWHVWLQNIAFNAQPNAAHKTIAAMDEYFPEFMLITQNIDTLHERAGTKRMLKIHGDIMQMLCLKNKHLIQLTNPIAQDALNNPGSLPKCPYCGSTCRPNVVWFGECLCQETMERARDAVHNCDLLLIVGTSGAVSGGYGFAQLAMLNKALIVEVNTEQSALSHLVDEIILEPAAAVLPMLFDNFS